MTQGTTAETVLPVRFSERLRALPSSRRSFKSSIPASSSKPLISRARYLNRATPPLREIPQQANRILFRFVDVARLLTGLFSGFITTGNR